MVKQAEEDAEEEAEEEVSGKLIGFISTITTKFINIV